MSKLEKTINIAAADIAALPPPPQPQLLPFLLLPI